MAEQQRRGRRRRLPRNAAPAAPPVWPCVPMEGNGPAIPALPPANSALSFALSFRLRPDRDAAPSSFTSLSLVGSTSSSAASPSYGLVWRQVPSHV